MEHYILKASIKNKKSHHNNLIYALNKAVLEVYKKFKHTFLFDVDFPYPFSFQCFFSNMFDCSMFIFELEEHFIHQNINCKLNIVIYHDKLINTKNSNYAFEKVTQALTKCNEYLDSIKKSDNRVLVVTDNKKQSLYLNNLWLFYTHFVDNWSFSDYKFVATFLQLMSYQEVAKAHQINISNGWRKEKKLNMKVYYTIKEMLLSD